MSEQTYQACLDLNEERCYRVTVRRGREEVWSTSLSLTAADALNNNDMGFVRAVDEAAKVLKEHGYVPPTMWYQDGDRLTGEVVSAS